MRWPFQEVGKKQEGVFWSGGRAGGGWARGGSSLSRPTGTAVALL